MTPLFDEAELRPVASAPLADRALVRIPTGAPRLVERAQLGPKRWLDPKDFRGDEKPSDADVFVIHQLVFVFWRGTFHVGCIADHASIGAAIERRNGVRALVAGESA